jgi:hypothetical protein
MKIVVFDLDETLGYFVEFGIFWDCLHSYLMEYNEPNKELSQDDFNIILDLYPEFLRPNIIHILNYLKNKKQSKCCHGMMIYTNNQGPKKWAEQLVSYFEKKINFKMFDQIIAAFKIDGKKIEICRTSHDKSYKDLIKCTKLPAHSEICFLDDSYHPNMSNKNVYYINIKPYIHDIAYETMIDRFVKSSVSKKIVKDDKIFKTFMLKYFNVFNYTLQDKTEEETNIDKILSKQIMVHLQGFFNKSRSRKQLANKTRRNSNGGTSVNKNKTFKLH